MSNPIITIQMQNGGVIKAELYPEYAPNTVNNFLALVNKGFYDGLIFHRVVRGFVIQGGDPTGSGSGGPGYKIKGEFSENGYKNALSHKRGVLSMARAQHPDSAGSPFLSCMPIPNISTENMPLSAWSRKEWALWTKSPVRKRARGIDRLPSRKSQK